MNSHPRRRPAWHSRLRSRRLRRPACALGACPAGHSSTRRHSVAPSPHAPRTNAGSRQRPACAVDGAIHDFLPNDCPYRYECRLLVLVALRLRESNAHAGKGTYRCCEVRSTGTLLRVFTVLKLISYLTSPGGIVPGNEPQGRPARRQSERRDLPAMTSRTAPFAGSAACGASRH